MVASDSVLKRYALAYIKKSGGNSDVKKFLRYFNNTRNLTWDEDTFAEACKEHTRLNSTDRHTESRNNQYNAGNDAQPTGPQVCVAFHVGMCFWYNSSRKAARKEEKIDYLDNKLKMLRNIEFAVGAVSLAALVACAVYPVLPVWGLVILGVNSLVCFAGGLAFHMKHEKESENIKKAEEAVGSYLQDTSPSAPLLSELNNSNVGGVFGN